MKEIERKFLVKDDGWMCGAMEKFSVRQGYMAFDPAIRVRTIGDKAFLTIKSANAGMERMEFEYEIPFEDAVQMTRTLPMKFVEKVRYQVTINDRIWEIDVFQGENSGLVIAEVEFGEDEEQPTFHYSWLGEEVTDDARYYNADLALNPYGTWAEE